MRTVNYCIYAFFLLMITTGCNKWLDTQPSDQISDTKLYDNADGFKSALNGVYQQVSVPDLYGHQLTWGLASAIGQDYNEDGLDYKNYYLAVFNYTQATYAVPLITSIWSKSYNIIANCNKIINEITPRDTNFFPLKSAEKNLILGEAKAMRALLHFEMVRLFAPAPLAQPQGLYIPYQTVYPANYAPPMPTNVVMDSIIRDFEEAQSLVARNDTIINRTVMSYKLQSLLSGSNTPVGGMFFNFRLNRLNYVAIQGLLARAYLYKGDYAKALEKSEYLYKQFGPSGRLKWWAWTASYNASGADKYSKFVDDVILAFYDPNLVSSIKSIKLAYFPFQLSDEVRNWFPTTERDYREGLIDFDTKISAKWQENTSTAQWRQEQNFIMPVLRFSEIYLIYAEALFHEGRTTDALTIFNEFRYARGKTTTFTSTVPADFYDELFREYRREFLEEGQTVFNHKRIGRPLEVGTRRFEIDQRFVLPIPEGESIF